MVRQFNRFKRQLNRPRGGYEKQPQINKAPDTQDRRNGTARHSLCFIVAEHATVYPNSPCCA